VQFAQIGNCAEITTNGFHSTINGVLYKEQERLKSELKSKTAELDLLTAKLQRNYALGKKQLKWPSLRSTGWLTELPIK